ncbi:MAG: response regulator [Planctomycetota bacterium]
MKRILFVDDEPNVLSGLRRGLRAHRSEWELHFAGSAEEAIEVLAGQEVDVIVTDMRMPGMDGAELLKHVADQHPSLVRIALSGQSDEEILLKSAAPTHQFLTKPCAAEVVFETISRACALRDLLAGGELQRLVASLGALPILPDIFSRIQAAVQDPKFSIQDIGDIVAQDIGLSTKILQIVNSAFFGLRTKVSSPGQATCLLGLEIVKALVLTAAIFDSADFDEDSGIDFDELWRHSNMVGALARRLGKAEGQDKAFMDLAFLAGLLHDVGRLVLACNLPARLGAAVRRAGEDRFSLWKCEAEELGSSHAEIGAYLLGLWGMPDSIVEATAFHHHPDDCLHEGFAVLTAVHAADALLRETDGGPPLESVSRGYLDRLDLSGRLEAWRAERDAMLQGDS